VLLHRPWATGEVYEPLHDAERSGPGAASWSSLVIRAKEGGPHDTTETRSPRTAEYPISPGLATALRGLVPPREEADPERLQR
jgi:hypothetical protein